MCNTQKDFVERQFSGFALLAIRGERERERERERDGNLTTESSGVSDLPLKKKEKNGAAC